MHWISPSVFTALHWKQIWGKSAERMLERKMDTQMRKNHGLKRTSTKTLSSSIISLFTTKLYGTFPPNPAFRMRYDGTATVGQTTLQWNVTNTAVIHRSLIALTRQAPKGPCWELPKRALRKPIYPSSSLLSTSFHFFTILIAFHRKQLTPRAKQNRKW